MSTGNHHRGKEQFWRAIVQQWRRSGLSVRAFCHKKGLAEPSFYGWRRTLAQRDSEPVRFVPVRVVQEEPKASPQGDGSSGLELLLSAGRVLRIGPSFDGPTLQRLLALLEEGRP